MIATSRSQSVHAVVSRMTAFPQKPLPASHLQPIFCTCIEKIPAESETKQGCADYAFAAEAQLRGVLFGFVPTAETAGESITAFPVAEQSIAVIRKHRNVPNADGLSAISAAHAAVNLVVKP